MYFYVKTHVRTMYFIRIHEVMLWVTNMNTMTDACVIYVSYVDVFCVHASNNGYVRQFMQVNIFINLIKSWYQNGIPRGLNKYGHVFTLTLLHLPAKLGGNLAYTEKPVSERVFLKKYYKSCNYWFFLRHITSLFLVRMGVLAICFVFQKRCEF